jgi:signal transduction histidine kinase
MKRKRRNIEIRDKITIQISIVLLIVVLAFISIHWIKIFSVEKLFIKQNDLLLSIIISIAIFGIVMIFFAMARWRDILELRDKLNISKNEIKKSKTDTLHILDAFPSMICYSTINSRITWANKSLLQFDKDANGKYLNEVFHIEELNNAENINNDLMENIIQRTIESKSLVKQIVYYPPNTLGTNEQYIEYHSIPLTGSKDEITYIAIAGINITGKIQLKESSGRLVAIVEASQDAIFVIGTDKTIHSWNSSAELMFGYNASEIVGQPITILDHIINFETLISISDYNDIENSRAIKHIELVKLNNADTKVSNIKTFTNSDSDNKTSSLFSEAEMQEKIHTTTNNNNTNSKITYVSLTVYPFVDDTGKVIGISVIVRDRTDAIKAEEQLAFSELQMRKLALHLDAVREEERKQIAFAIHDELGYALSAIKMDINLLKKTLDKCNNSTDDRITDMLNLVDTTIQKVKTLAANLRPSILDHFGLIAAIEEQAGEFQRRTGIRCKVSVFPSDIEVEDKLRTPIFRIFQEAQTNITRYAKASRVDVQISYRNGLFTMEVSDNGIGISVDKVNAISSFGLLGIREKATSIGGKATIKGKHNEGTTVSLELPLAIGKKGELVSIT